MSILRNNSAKGRKIIEIFPKLYVSRSKRCVVCYKILELNNNINYNNLKEIFCLREKYILIIVSHGQKLSEILFIILQSSSNVYIHQLIVLS
jgi:uncharacterized membrane-anchored protein YitT (DUF2179 family)